MAKILVRLTQGGGVAKKEDLELVVPRYLLRVLLGVYPVLPLNWRTSLETDEFESDGQSLSFPQLIKALLAMRKGESIELMTKRSRERLWADREVKPAPRSALRIERLLWGLVLIIGGILFFVVQIVIFLVNVVSGGGQFSTLLLAFGGLMIGLAGVALLGIETPKWETP